MDDALLMHNFARIKCCLLELRNRALTEMFTFVTPYL